MKTSSKIIIGGYNITKYGKEGHKIYWSKIISKNKWAVRLSSVNLIRNFNGMDEKAFNINAKSKVAILDSGISDIIMPAGDFKKLIKYFRLIFKLTFEQKNKMRSRFFSNCTF